MTSAHAGLPGPPVGIGLLGCIGEQLPPGRLEAATKAAPWRGMPSGIEKLPGGLLAGLGHAEVCQDGNLAIALHGRVDNLITLASRFGTDRDDAAGTIAAAYRHIGDNVARHLMGDFALLILDGNRGVLLGARDWIGARPLFWGQHRGITAFGSEVKQVLALLDLPHVTDEDALAAYEEAGLPAVDATFSRDVRAVMPNGQLLATSSGLTHASAAPVRFEAVEAGVEEAAAEVRRLLANAVRRRTAGAHRIAAMVSGGMDSTSVAAMAAHLERVEGCSTVIAGLTLTFPSFPSCDESSYAQQVAERAGILWVPVPISPGDLRAAVPGSIALHDGPIFPSVGAEYLVARAAELGANMLLSGRLSDHWQDHRGHEFELSVLRGEWSAAARHFALILRRSPRRAVWAALRAGRHRMQRRRAEEVFERRACNYMARTTLEVEEREGMRRGIQAEFPFGDEELARYLAGLSPSVKSFGVSPKGVLRAAMSDLLPESVLTRVGKTAFDSIVVAAFSTDDQENQNAATAAFPYYAARYRGAMSQHGRRTAAD